MKLLKEQDTKWKRIDYFLFFILMLIATVLLFNNLTRETIPTFDESRNSYADFIMLHKSADIFMPDSGYLKERYFVKPPLKSWIKYPFYRLFGFSLFTSRFLDAFMALLTVLVTFVLGRYLLGGWVGFTSGFILVTTEGIYRYWSRTNQYDSGFVFGVILFFYFFIRFYKEKPWGFLICGMALAFAFYFKHIMMLVPLGLAGIYFLMLKDWKEILRARFWGMTAVAIGLPAAWYIPFQLKNPEFFATFIKVEFVQRVVTGYGKKKSLVAFYIEALEFLGDWLYILPVALVIATYLIFRNKNTKLKFLLVWAYIPLIILTLAKFKSPRYIYFLYPVFGYFIGLFLVKVYGFITSQNVIRSRAYKIIFITLLLGFSSLQIIKSMQLTAGLPQTSYHRFCLLFDETNDVSLFVHSLGRRDFERSEFLHLYFTKNKTGSDKSLALLVHSLGENDAVLTSRKDFMRMFRSSEEPEKIKFEDYSYYNFTTASSLKSGSPVEKVAIFNTGSALEEYLKSLDVKVYPLKHPSLLIDYEMDGNGEFILNAGYTILGYDPNKFILEYYAGLLERGDVDRRFIADLFSCMAARHERHYRFYSMYSGLDYGMTGDHPYRILIYKGLFNRITTVNIRQGSIFKPAWCEIGKYFLKWKTHTDMSPQMLLNMVLKLQESKALLVPIKLITKLEVIAQERGINLTGFLYSDFRFNPKRRITQKSYFPKALIFRKDGAIYQALSAYSIEMKSLD